MKLSDHLRRRDIKKDLITDRPTTRAKEIMNSIVKNHSYKNGIDYYLPNKIERLRKSGWVTRKAYFDVIKHRSNEFAKRDLREDARKQLKKDYTRHHGTGHHIENLSSVMLNMTIDKLNRTEFIISQYRSIIESILHTSYCLEGESALDFITHIEGSLNNVDYEAGNGVSDTCSISRSYNEWNRRRLTKLLPKITKAATKEQEQEQNNNNILKEFHVSRIKPKNPREP